jgi:hypothetical protein
VEDEAPDADGGERFRNVGIPGPWTIIGCPADEPRTEPVDRRDRASRQPDVENVAARTSTSTRKRSAAATASKTSHPSPDPDVSATSRSEPRSARGRRSARNQDSRNAPSSPGSTAEQSALMARTPPRIPEEGDAYNVAGRAPKRRRGGRRNLPNSRRAVRDDAPTGATRRPPARRCSRAIEHSDATGASGAASDIDHRFEKSHGVPILPSSGQSVFSIYDSTESKWGESKNETHTAKLRDEIARNATRSKVYGTTRIVRRTTPPHRPSDAPVLWEDTFSTARGRCLPCPLPGVIAVGSAADCRNRLGDSRRDLR